MRITIFGLTLSSSWGNGHATPYRAILRALHRRGNRVTFFEKDVPYYAAHRDLPTPDFCELHLYDSWEQVRAQALKIAAESDVVITASYCPRGAIINQEVLSLASPVKVYYDLDTPVTLNRLRSNQPVDYVTPEQLSAFDLVLSWTGGLALAELRKDWGAEKAQPLFGCVDPDDYRRTDQRKKFECALSYMGTYAADRQGKLNDLFLEPSRRRPDLRFLLAGSMYPWGSDWGVNVTKTEHVPPSEHSALYSSSHCTLNITRAEMAASGFCPSGRFFEAAACGTPIISDWFDGLDHFFAPDHELWVAQSADDVVRILNLADDDLRKIANRARERTLDEHTGDHRAQQLLEYCEQAVSKDRSNEEWTPGLARETRETA